METQLLNEMKNNNVCRFCSQPLQHSLVNLGMSPLCESYLPADKLNVMEPFYPLHAQVCSHCYLVQLDQYVSPEHIFSEYAYFSSFSETWLQHAAQYVEMITERLQLRSHHFVVELASNDGYLLKNFLAKDIPVLGVEPAENVAQVAKQQGVPTLVEFFGVETARNMVANGMRANLIIGNNVLAQVPDLNDFVAGIQILLKPQGVATLEFPHLMQLMAHSQYDTIYHEHFCYFSFLAAEQIFARHGLTLFDVEELPTHGGSLRIYARHAADNSQPVSARATELHRRERAAGLHRMETYLDFSEQVRESKRSLLEFLIQARRAGKTVAGYGAPGKGNTLLNYCGVRADFLDFTVDRNPYKQGKYLPGTHIPVFAPSMIDQVQPDYVLILPWNFKDEIMQQLRHIGDWGGQFVIPIPTATVLAPPRAA